MRPGFNVDATLRPDYSRATDKKMGAEGGGGVIFMRLHRELSVLGTAFLVFLGLGLNSINLSFAGKNCDRWVEGQKIKNNMLMRLTPAQKEHDVTLIPVPVLLAILAGDLHLIYSGGPGIEYESYVSYALFLEAQPQAVHPAVMMLDPKQKAAIFNQYPVLQSIEFAKLDSGYIWQFITKQIADFGAENILVIRPSVITGLR